MKIIEIVVKGNRCFLSNGDEAVGSEKLNGTFGGYGGIRKGHMVDGQTSELENQLGGCCSAL